MRTARSRASRSTLSFPMAIMRQASSASRALASAGSKGGPPPPMQLMHRGFVYDRRARSLPLLWNSVKHASRTVPVAKPLAALRTPRARYRCLSSEPACGTYLPQSPQLAPGSRAAALGMLLILLPQRAGSRPAHCATNPAEPFLGTSQCSHLDTVRDSRCASAAKPRLWLRL